MKASQGSVGISSSVRRLVEKFDEEASSQHRRKRDTQNRNGRTRRLFARAYESLLDWKEDEVPYVDEAQREEHVELQLAKSLLRLQHESKAAAAFQLQDLCDEFKRCSTIDLHVDPNGPAPISTHNIIDIQHHEAILSVLLQLECTSNKATTKTTPPLLRPQSQSQPVDNHCMQKENVAVQAREVDSGGWIPDKLFMVDNEIDTSRWTSYCETGGGSDPREEWDGRIVWGNARGPRCSEDPNLWEFTGAIPTYKVQMGINQTNAKARQSNMEPGQGTVFDLEAIKREKESPVTPTLPPCLEPHTHDTGMKRARRSYDSMGTCCTDFDHLLGNEGQGVEVGLTAEPYVSIERDLVPVALQALEGVQPAIEFLESGLKKVEFVQAASLSRLVKKISRAGHVRMKLESFLNIYLHPKEHLMHSLPSRRYVDPIHFAFASAVQSVLRWHSAALQHLPESVKDRRSQEALQQLGPVLGLTTLQDSFLCQKQKSGKHATGLTSYSTGFGTLSEVVNGLLEKSTAFSQRPAAAVAVQEDEDDVELLGTGPGGSDATLLEVVLHTERIQQQTHMLASICGLAFLDNALTEHNVQGQDDMVVCESDDQDSDSDGIQLPGASELLSLLYTELLESDNIVGPMIRYLFACSFQPYIQYVREWLFTCSRLPDVFLHPLVINRKDGIPNYELVPATPPSFLEQVHEKFTEAGQQLRLIHMMDMGGKGVKNLVERTANLANEEAEEACRLTEALEDEWGMCDVGFGEVGLKQWGQNGRSERYFPVPFRVDALHEVVEAMSSSSRRRFAEVEHLLSVLAQKRTLEKEIRDAELIERFQNRMAQIEIERMKKCEEVSERRKKRAELLQQQKDALDEYRAKKAADRAEELRLEQNMLEESARKEHEEAAKKLASELEKAKQVVAEADRRARQLEWQAKRSELGFARQDLLRKIAATERAELNLHTLEISTRPPQDSPGLNNVPPNNHEQEQRDAHDAGDDLDDDFAPSPMDIDSQMDLDSVPSPHKSGEVAMELDRDVGANNASMGQGFDNGQQIERKHKRSEWQPPVDPRPAAGLPSSTPQEDFQATPTPKMNFSHFNSSIKSEMGSRNVHRRQWGGVEDPRPAAGLPRNNAVDLSASVSKKRVSISRGADRQFDNRVSASSGLASPSKRASRSRWKLDNAKGIVLEEVEVDERWLLGGEESLVPVSASIDACVIQPIITQYRCASYACSQLLIQELGLLQLCAQLRRFYFLEVGDWASNLINLLCSRAMQKGDINNSDLHWMLGEAFRDSSCSEDPIIKKMNLQLEPDRCLPAKPNSGDSSSNSSSLLTLRPPKVSGSRTQIDLQVGRLDLLDMVTLTVDIDWPLNLVLSGEGMERYQEIFTMLLRLGQVKWWMDKLWWRFREAEQQRAEATRKVEQRLRRVRLWYQDAQNFLKILQSSMQHQLVSSHWGDFEKEIKTMGVSLRKIQEAHANYLEAAARSCFLSSTGSLRRIIDKMLQNMLNFCSLLDPQTSQNSSPLSLNDLLSRDDVFNEAHKFSAEVMQRSRALYRLLKYRANKDGHMVELYVMMTFNSYYNQDAGSALAAG